MRWNLIRRETVDSTNEVAKDLIARGAEPWTVVLADRQVEGKGRFGRKWSSPRGGLYASVIVQEDLSRLPLVSLAAGVAVVEALTPLGLKPTLKWPNDVLVEGAKVAGILVEGLVRPDAYWAVIGIGINSDVPLDDLPPQLTSRATTLRHLLGRRVDNESLLESLLKALRRWYPSPGKEMELLSRYRALCSTLGSDVVVETGSKRLRGRALDVSAEGLLILETETGERVEVSEGSILEA
jgi:BirA family biotin operon repressor/biotin-[acetyl-CoA-carboxylase] ligase